MKKILLIVFGLITLVIIAAIIYFNVAFPKVSPAPDIKIDMSVANIERGKYLANHVAVCIDCHSTRDYSFFSGPPAPGTEGRGGEAFTKEMGLPGNYYAQNITPYYLGNWTDGEIYRAMTAGVTKDGRALFPIMPWHNYADMTKEDIYAIIAYIRTLPPIAYDAQKSEPAFPMNIINKIMPRDAVHPKSVDKSNVVEYGKYIYTASACNDCHTQKDKGKIIPGKEYAGGMEFNTPMGLIKTANISPDMETGIGSWSKEQFIQRFKNYDPSIAPLNKVKMGDFNSVMPWSMYAGMTEEDLGALFEFLKSVKPVNNKVVHFAPPKKQAQ